MKTYLFSIVAAMSLLASSCVLAEPYNETDSNNRVIRGTNTIDNSDSNGLVQGSDTIESQEANQNSPLDDSANSVLGAGVSRDGETMGEED